MFYHKSNPHNTCMDWAHEGREKKCFCFPSFSITSKCFKKRSMLWNLALFFFKQHLALGLCSISSCCVHLSSVFISLAEHCTQEHLMRLYTYTIFPKVFCHLSSHPDELEWKPILNRQVLICHLPTIYSYDSFNSCWSCWYVTVVPKPRSGTWSNRDRASQGRCWPKWWLSSCLPLHPYPLLWWELLHLFLFHGGGRMSNLHLHHLLMHLLGLSRCTAWTACGGQRAHPEPEAGAKERAAQLGPEASMWSGPASFLPEASVSIRSECENDNCNKIRWKMRICGRVCYTYATVCLFDHSSRIKVVRSDTDVGQ